MFFNTIDFYIFITAVLLIIHLVTPQRFKLPLFLIINLVFYSFFGLKSFVILILLIITNYVFSLLIYRSTSSPRRIYAGFAVGLSVGILAFYKYSIPGLSFVTQGFSRQSLIVPVGLSFYTLSMLGYVADVYVMRIPAERNFIRFAAFSSFFPTIIMGPIGRSTILLEQLKQPLVFSRKLFLAGLKLVLLGLFQKLVIADRLGIYVDAVFSKPGNFSGLTLCIATVFFGFQLYGDFCSYSNIAIGIAKMFGIELPANFRQPYLSRSPIEFWRRWHISLSTWLMDYVFTPLQLIFRNSSVLKLFAPLMLTFLISGLWHGSTINFIIWGVLHGCYIFLYSFFRSRSKKHVVNYEYTGGRFRSVFSIVVTFLLVNFAWVFFRAATWADALTILRAISHMELSVFIGMDDSSILGYCSLAILFSIGIDLYQYKPNNRLVLLLQKYPPLQIGVYAFMIILILLLGALDGSQFIYVQF